MATKLSPKQVKALTAVGIKDTTTEGAKKQLLKLLKAEQVTGVEDETLEELISMYETFYTADEDDEEEVEETDEEI